MARVTANFNIPRDDVYEGTVKTHREAGSFNKLLTALITAYHDNPEVQLFVDSRMSKAQVQENRDLTSLLDRMKATISEGDLLVEEGSFAGEGYKDEVREGYIGAEPQSPIFGRVLGSATVQDVSAEMEMFRTELREIKSLLKNLVMTNAGVSSVQQSEPEGGTQTKGMSSLQVVDVESQKSDTEVEINFNVPVEVWKGVDEALELFNSNNQEKGIVEKLEDEVDVESEETSANLLDSLLSGGMLQ